VRLVVVDPRILATAFVAPGGRARKLLVLLAYGRLAAYTRLFGPAEEETLKTDAAAEGGKIGGQPSAELRAEDEQRAALLFERIPGYPPNEWGLVTSQHILAEVEDAVQFLRADLPSLPADAAEIAFRQLVSISSRIVEPDETSMPAYTEWRARSHDHIIHAAVTAGAEFLVTNDDRIATARTSAQPYHNEKLGAGTKAVRLAYFVEETLYSYHFNLDDIDGELLQLAGRPLTETS
jgi:predicted nucleic acid-binding protein